MTLQQRQRAATEIDEMLHWTLTSSLQRDGSFKTVPSFFSSIGADFYFGVSFLQTIGFWDRKDRFWTERDFPEAPGHLPSDQSSAEGNGAQIARV
jgi:hypothetical protein